MDLEICNAGRTSASNLFDWNSEPLFGTHKISSVNRAKPLLFGAHKISSVNRAKPLLFGAHKISSANRAKPLLFGTHKIRVGGKLLFGTNKISAGGKPEASPDVQLWSLLFIYWPKFNQIVFSLFPLGW